MTVPPVERFFTCFIFYVLYYKAIFSILQVYFLFLAYFLIISHITHFYKIFLKLLFLFISFTILY